MTQIDSFELVLVALRDPVAADIRLRRALKGLLRRYRFQCTSVKSLAHGLNAGETACSFDGQKTAPLTPGAGPRRAVGQAKSKSERMGKK